MSGCVRVCVCDQVQLCVSACKGTGQKEVRQWQHQKTATKNLKKADLKKGKEKERKQPGKKGGNRRGITKQTVTERHGN